jgi:hypothetical protein
MLVVFGYSFLPSSPKPFSVTYYDEAGTEIATFSPYAFIGIIITSFWLIFCMWFKPIAKQIFPPWAMEDQPINIETVCETCDLKGGDTLGCFMSPKRCGKYSFKNGKWKESIF